MTQPKGKVNHFGKTDVSNLYKNQQITNHLNPVFMSFDTICSGKFAANGSNCRAFQSPQSNKERPKNCGLDRLSFKAGLGFGSYSCYLIRAGAAIIPKMEVSFHIDVLDLRLA